MGYLWLVCDLTFTFTLVSIAAFSMASAILADNEFYQSHLHQFLVPAVGNKWLLCYRASTHGWAVNSFHSRCDGRHDTVTIVKVGDYVFGGYTDIPWGKYFPLMTEYYCKNSRRRLHFLSFPFTLSAKSFHLNGHFLESTAHTLKN